MKGNVKLCQSQMQHHSLIHISNILSASFYLDVEHWKAQGKSLFASCQTKTFPNNLWIFYFIALNRNWLRCTSLCFLTRELTSTCRINRSGFLTETLGITRTSAGSSLLTESCSQHTSHSVMLKRKAPRASRKRQMWVIAVPSCEHVVFHLNKRSTILPNQMKTVARSQLVAIEKQASSYKLKWFQVRL